VSEPDLAIRVRGLRKRYGDLEAVAGIDLSVQRGEVFALLGPNGAGKTTTVEILEGYRTRSAGEVEVLGKDPAGRDVSLRRRVGIVLQSTGVDPFLTVRETVELYAGYYAAPRNVDDVIELVGLQEKRDAKVVRLSGGQHRRLDVAVALAGDPELLFLDEPTTGFDPGARRNAWEIMRNLAELGKTVFLTTHYMDEAQNLADRVAVIAHGRIVAEGDPDEIGGRRQAETTIRFVRPVGEPLPVDGAASANGLVEIRTAEPTRVLHQLTSWATARGVELEGLEVRQPSLEDVYLELTGGEVGAE
jgi:ABC-2 type transport system ATP-binding protein